MGAFASGARAKGICDRCGLTFRLLSLRGETIGGKPVGNLVCEGCWDADHPQNFIGRYPINDPVALRNPRPDAFGESRNIVWGWRPLMGVQARTRTGRIRVVTS